MLVAFAHAPLSVSLMFFGAVLVGLVAAIALVEWIWEIEDDPVTMCFQVTDADTGEVLTTTLDESNWSETEKYRDAFEDAVWNWPLRHIVVKRVPVSTWDAM